MRIPNDGLDKGVLAWYNVSSESQLSGWTRGRYMTEPHREYKSLRGEGKTLKEWACYADERVRKAVIREAGNN